MLVHPKLLAGDNLRLTSNELGHRLGQRLPPLRAQSGHLSAAPRQVLDEELVARPPLARGGSPSDPRVGGGKPNSVVCTAVPAFGSSGGKDPPVGPALCTRGPGR